MLGPFPVLETERLVLREVVEGDAPDLLRIHGDAHHMRWFGSDPLPDLEAAHELVRKFAAMRVAKQPGHRWAITRKGDDCMLGTCSLFAWHQPWRKCATGYELAPEHTGHGYMREALARIFTWGFAEMGELNRIEAQVHPDNAPSLRLLAGLGFVQEGRLREVGYWAGRHHDLLQLGLLRRDWQVPSDAH